MPECSICYVDTDSVSWGDPDAGACHGFCRPCLVTYISGKLASGRAVKVRCPQAINDGCSVDVTSEFIQQFVEADLFARYERFLQMKSDEYRACPKCAHVQERVGDAVEMQCAQCSQAYCFLHDLAHSSAAGACLAHEQKVQAESRETLEFIASSTMRCPGCRVAVNKEEGCDHISCDCGTEFCCQTHEAHATPSQHAAAPAAADLAPCCVFRQMCAAATTRTATTRASVRSLTDRSRSCRWRNSDWTPSVHGSSPLHRPRRVQAPVRARLRRPV